jgi:hypothetical protein
VLLATSYLTVAQFTAQANDYDLSPYTNSQLQDLLNRASGKADSIMRKSYLAQRKTQRYIGQGTNNLELQHWPIISVERVQIIVPGTQGITLPVNEILIDYGAGSMYEYTPLYWMGAGYLTMFPDKTPIDVTYTHGYGYSVAVAPPATSLVITDINGSGLPVGTYNLAFTAKTFSGETTATVQQFATSLGTIQVNITPGLGVYVYRAYLSSATHNTTVAAAHAAGDTSVVVGSASGMTAGSQWLYGAGTDAEVVTVGTPAGTTVPIVGGLVNAHVGGEAFIPVPMLVAESASTSYGVAPLTIVLNSTTAPVTMYSQPLPTSDTSAPQVPNAIVEGTRLLALSILWEQNNLANRGVALQVEGDKRIGWRSTEGASGRGVPLAEQQATVALQPYSLQGIF